MLPLSSRGLKSREHKALHKAFGQVFGQEAGLDELPEVPSNLNLCDPSQVSGKECVMNM